MPAKRAAGEAALKLMDEHLGGRDWFVGDAITLADISLFAYTHVAEDGGFEPRRYPARRRLARPGGGRAAAMCRWSLKRLACRRRRPGPTSPATPAAP